MQQPAEDHGAGSTASRLARPLGFEARMPVAPQEALERVTTALGAEGFGVLTRIDVQGVFRDKLGVEFRPYTILGACNPRLAHRALGLEPEVGLLLPCNVTVEVLPTGGCLVRIADPAVMLSAGSLGDNAGLKELMEEARSCLSRVAQVLRDG